jgi:hypothetical protein|nr:MAG TPA: hypothetical protein [Bacteriophage sp.]
MSEHNQFKLKQYSDVFNKKVVSDYLYLVGTSGAYSSAISSCGSQALFESTFLNGGSSDKIASHYRYFKDITNYIRCVNGCDIAKMDVFGLLFVLAQGSRKIKLDSFINNVFIRHHNIQLLNHLYYLCDGASISYSEYEKRFVGIYISLFGNDAYEDNTDDYFDDFMDTTYSLLYTFSKRTSEVFSDETFEKSCAFSFKIYLTTNIRLLQSDKYQSKGVEFDACVDLYSNVLVRAKKNAFVMSRKDNTADLISYIKDYESVNGAKCVSNDRTIYNFLDTMFDYLGLLSKCNEFVKSIMSGADFSELDRDYKLHKYGITDVEELINTINTELIWVALELPTDYEDYICDVPYGVSDIIEDDVEGDDEYGITAKIVDSGSIVVTPVGTLSYDIGLDTESGTSFGYDVKHDFDGSDVAVKYDKSMIHSVLYAIIRGDIDSSNYKENLYIEDTWSFIQDIVNATVGISYGSVVSIVESFVCEVIFDIK